jgi:hypothetical protein
VGRAQQNGHGSIRHPDTGKPMKISSTVLCTLLLTACAGSQPVIPAVQVDGMVIENKTQMWLSAVRVCLPERGAFMSCGNISPGSMCSTSFPATAYTGEALEVTWSQGGQIHSTGQFVMDIPRDSDSEFAAVVHVVIAGPGSAGAVLVQQAQ